MDISQQIYNKALMRSNFISFVIDIIPELLGTAFCVSVIILLIIIIKKMSDK